ncbi:MAG: SatD family protein [Chromatocurvus sp.]
MSVQYLVLIGDLRDSRRVKDRAGLQCLFESSLASLNERFQSALASPLTITLGDEFQAVFSDPLPVWEILSALQARLFPITARFGLGLGEIATPINSQAALGMDGPAFYHARDAIVLLKKQGGNYRIEGIDDVDLINHALSLVSELQESWHGNRFATYHSFLAGVPVQQIAQALKISKTAVYKNLHDGHLHSISGIQRSIATKIAATMEATETDSDERS